MFLATKAGGILSSRGNVQESLQSGKSDKTCVAPTFWHYLNRKRAEEQIKNVPGAIHYSRKVSKSNALSEFDTEYRAKRLEIIEVDDNTNGA